MMNIQGKRAPDHWNTLDDTASVILDPVEGVILSVDQVAPDVWPPLTEVYKVTNVPGRHSEEGA